jgi:hypothetical protein
MKDRSGHVVYPQADAWRLGMDIENNRSRHA